MPRVLRLLLAVALAGTLLLTACGGDDDSSSGSTTTTTADDGGGGGGDTTGTTGTGGSGSEDDSPYCLAARDSAESGDVPKEERTDLFQRQLDNAPDEIKSDLETLSDNLDALLEDPQSLPADAKAALDGVLAYQSSVCGVVVGS